MLGYFLPKARAGVRASQRILRCPSAAARTAAARTIGVITTIAIDSQVVADPDRFVSVNGRSGILSGRTTHLELRRDGTLASFNASTEGQGGEVISAVIGVASTLGALAIGAPPVAVTESAQWTTAHAVRCTAETEALVARAAAVDRQLSDLRARVATNGATGADAQVLADLTAEQSELVDQLTLASAVARFDPSPGDFGADGVGLRPSPIAAIDYTPWFGESGDEVGELLDRSRVPGRYGFRANVATNRRLLDTLGGAARLPVSAHSDSYLYYRRPVAVTIAAAPCPVAWIGDDCPMPAQPDPRRWYADGPAEQKTVLFPQLSRLFWLPIGRGGIFGTRSAKAEFDEQGAPTMLEFGSTAGGAEIAGVINAAGAAIPTLRDARTDALNRQIDRQKALDELHDLLAPPPPPAPPQQDD